MKSKSVRICLIVMAAYLILGAFFYPIAGDSLHFTDDITETVSAKATLESMEIGDTVRQSFLCEYDVLKTLTVIPSTMAKQKYDVIEVKLTDDGGNTVYETRFGTNTLRDHEEFIIPIDPDNGGIQNAASDQHPRCEGQRDHLLLRQLRGYGTYRRSRTDRGHRGALFQRGAHDRRKRRPL